MAPEGWQERVGFLEWHLGNDVGPRWWKQVKSDCPDDFRTQVDEILAGSGFESNRKMLDALMVTTNRP